MPESVMIGQKWSVWLPSRRQWLLATVTAQEHGSVTFECDSRYDLPPAENELKADAATVLGASNLFRFVSA